MDIHNDRQDMHCLAAKPVDAKYMLYTINSLSNININKPLKGF